MNIETYVLGSIGAAVIGAIAVILINRWQRDLEIKKESILMYAEAASGYRNSMVQLLLFSKKEELMSCEYFKELITSIAEYNKKLDRVYLTCSDKNCEKIEIEHIKMIERQSLIIDAAKNFEKVPDRLSELNRNGSSFLNELNKSRINLLEILGTELNRKTLAKTKKQIEGSEAKLEEISKKIKDRAIERLNL